MASATSRSTRRLIAGFASLAVAAALAILNGRTEAANPLTLKTVTIDGNVSDWDAVLGNALQTTRDGDGSSSAIAANCALYSTDRDCPMGGGAGNDLHTFAWTYDASYVYLYIERYGSTSNGVDFFFVADANRDKRLEATGDEAIHARWWGSTGNVTVDAGAYAPVDAVNGDAIVSGAGYVDGYDLAGSNGTLSAITCAAGAMGLGVTAGADAGRKMELRIPWCAFGVSSGQPFYWHVVSTNNGSLNTPLDNIGAPSGGLGSFVQRAVALFPDRSGAVLSPGVVTYDHTLANDGNDADVVGLRATSSQGARIEILDAGVVIGRDDEGDGTWELTPQVPLAASASKTLQVRITMPSGRTGQDVTRVTATSGDDPTASASVSDWSHVGSPAFVPETFSTWTQAGVAAAFAETLVNGQLAADTFDLTPGAGCAGDALLVTADAAGAQVVARDDDGDGAWDSVNVPDDTNANGLPDMGPIPGQTTRTFWLWVRPPPGAPEGSCTVQLTAASPMTAATARADHTVTVAPALAFAPSYTRAAGTSLRANVGGSVFFPALLRNSESVPRAYTFTQLLSPAGSGATARVWSDPDGDGSPADGVVVASTGTVAAFGGTQAVVIELLAGTAANGASLSLATTATSTSGGAAATQVSEADVSYLATYSDALHAHATSLFPPCATVYVHGSGLLPGDVTSYALTWLTPAATTARAVQPWPTTALGTSDDGFALPATAPTGSWTARLVDGPSTRDQSLSFTVELDARVLSLTTDKARYRPGETVQVTGAFQDAGRVVAGRGRLRLRPRRRAVADALRGHGRGRRDRGGSVRLHAAARDGPRRPDAHGRLAALLRRRGHRDAQRDVRGPGARGADDHPGPARGHQLDEPHGRGRGRGGRDRERLRRRSARRRGHGGRRGHVRGGRHAARHGDRAHGGRQGDRRRGEHVDRRRLRDGGRRPDATGRAGGRGRDEPHEGRSRGDRRDRRGRSHGRPGGRRHRADHAPPHDPDRGPVRLRALARRRSAQRGGDGHGCRGERQPRPLEHGRVRGGPGRSRASGGRRRRRGRLRAWRREHARGAAAAGDRPGDVPAPPGVQPC
jgi:hypothetical protein